MSRTMAVALPMGALLLVGLFLAMLGAQTIGQEQGRRDMCAEVGGTYVEYGLNLSRCAVTMVEKEGESDASSRN